MRKNILLLISLIAVLQLPLSCVENPSGKYKNGLFVGISRSIYTEQSYFGVTKVSISEDKISEIDFAIIDMENKVFFDKNYEIRFKDSPEYVEQCKNEWKAINIYPGQLLEKQDIDSVDAITGATWSYNMFESSLAEALKKASMYLKNNH
jgi:major membrane immunogen (membrane-anchored lipoprotein)